MSYNNKVRSDAHNSDVSSSNSADGHESVHDFDFSMICDYFSSIGRQGPGSEEATVKALSFVSGLSAGSVIADLGCGTGGQTVVLAQHSEASIVALDLFPAFLDKLSAKALSLGLSERISCVEGSMDNLPFKEGEFDVIWCEGAIYNIGFRKGISEWKKFLKSGGYIAVTESCWLTNDRPSEIENFWVDAYPEIDTVPHKMQQLQDAGYLSVAAFVLPSYCWTKNFYEPQLYAQEVFLKSHPENPAAAELVGNMRHEADMYSKYGRFYGYVFFVAKAV